MFLLGWAWDGETRQAFYDGPSTITRILLYLNIICLSFDKLVMFNTAPSWSHCFGRTSTDTWGLVGLHMSSRLTGRIFGSSQAFCLIVGALWEATDEVHTLTDWPPLALALPHCKGLHPLDCVLSPLKQEMQVLISRKWKLKSKP